METSTRMPLKKTSVAPRSGAVAIPRDRLAGLKENWKNDLTSGFIVFLIALPLCLGIAMASGVPPITGIISAIIGGLLVSQINGSYVTVCGPAAGLIVVILSAVDKLGGGEVGYHCTLAAIVLAGGLLFLAGVCKAGELGHFFPSSAVHGMLAAIGIIIMSKQIHIMLGVKPEAKEPLELIAEIPKSFAHMNPEIAIIGFVSLALLVAHGLIKNKTIKKIPAPLAVVLVAVGLGCMFDLEHAHSYAIGGHSFALDPKKFLVVLPSNIAEGITHPDFSKVGTMAFWVAVVSITLVQGIETLLSAAAVDRLDKFKRQSNLSRDMAAVGLGSTLSGMLGGLPMIAEIVRSSANVDNGARTRWSNFFHGACMLLFVALAASLIDKIPLAALAALLVFTGYRLASPRVFKETHEVGIEQTVIFVTTVVATLATDLLIGVSTGILTKLVLHIGRGAPITGLFKSDLTVSEKSPGLFFVEVHGAAIFSNYISMKRRLDKIPPGCEVVVDLSAARLVDHTVMDKLHHYAHDYATGGGSLDIVGLARHDSSSHHPLAARRLRV